MPEQYAATLESMKAFWSQVGESLPAIIAATILLMAGWIIARIVRRAMIRLLKLLRVDILAEKAGVEDFLLQGGVRFTAVTLVGNLLYWIIMFMAILAALNVMGLQNAATLVNKVIGFVPNVIVAVLLLMFGAFFARIARGITLTYLSNVGITGAEVLSRISEWAILLFVISVALEQLSIGGQILVSAFQIAFGAFCLALAIAFGMGGREWAAHLLERLWKK